MMILLMQSLLFAMPKVMRFSYFIHKTYSAFCTTLTNFARSIANSKILHLQAVRFVIIGIKVLL